MPTVEQWTGAFAFADLRRIAVVYKFRFQNGIARIIQETS